MINSVKLTQIINEAKQAVDDSAFGPLFTTDANDISRKGFNQLAWAVFGMVLQATLKEASDGSEIKG